MDSNLTEPLAVASIFCVVGSFCADVINARLTPPDWRRTFHRTPQHDGGRRRHRRKESLLLAGVYGSSRP